MMDTLSAHPLIRKKRGASGILPLLFLTILLLFAAVSGAHAAAPDPKLSYNSLMSRLSTAPAGKLDGYFLTVVQGSTIETIPATISGYTPAGNWRDSLIFFQATGPIIAQTQGIAEGMSGSPLYVGDPAVGGGELIGAVAYGNANTPSGHGLATPIEAMERTETLAETRAMLGLQRTQFVDGKIVDKVIITNHPEEHRADAAAGAFVARPLKSLLIGSVKTGSKAEKVLTKALDKHNISYRFTSLGGSATESTDVTTTPFVPGAPVFVLNSTGSLWSGALGTVTYVNGNNALLFGHTYNTPGKNLDHYMTNGWIAGVWPSQTSPYKLGNPTVIRGTASYDGLDGVLGKLDVETAQTKITSKFTNKDTREVRTGTTYIHQSSLQENSDGWYNAYGTSLVEAALALPGDQMFDYAEQKGMADVVTTIVVNDGTKTHTIKLKSSTASEEDITWTVPEDALDALEELTSINEWGIEKLRVLSIDVDAKVTTKLVTSTIASVEAPKGLKIGTTPVRVKLFAYGQANPLYVTSSITIPKGTKLNASDLTLMASASSTSYDDRYDEDEEEDYGYGASNLRKQTVEDPSDEPFERPTIAKIVTTLNAQEPHEAGKIFISLRQGSNQIATTNATTPTLASGITRVSNTAVTAKAATKTLKYGKGVMITGTVDGPLGTEIYVYGIPSDGKSEKLLATGRVSSLDDLNKPDPNAGSYSDDEDEDYDEDESYGLLYKIKVPPLKNNTKVRVVTKATAKYLSGASSRTTVKVKAKTRLKLDKTRVKRGKKVTLNATIIGKKLKGAKAVFEYKLGKKWVKIKTVKIKKSADKAAVKYKWTTPKKAGKLGVRVRFLGHKHNYKATSGVKRLTVQ